VTWLSIASVYHLPTLAYLHKPTSRHHAPLHIGNRSIHVNKAAVDWLLMGAEKGTRDMTWEEIEEGADKLRVKGGQTAQIVARAGALVSGAPCDESGQPTNKAAMDWLLMGAEEGTRNMTWEEIEEGADKLRAEGGKTEASRKRKHEGSLRGNDAMKVACFARGQDDCHSHACILPECGMFCTATLVERAGRIPQMRLRHDVTQMVKSECSGS